MDAAISIKIFGYKRTEVELIFMAFILTCQDKQAETLSHEFQIHTRA